LAYLKIKCDNRMVTAIF